MATTPAFPVTPRLGRAVLTAATTDKTGATTTNIVDILTGAATGTKIDEVVIQATDNPADSTVMLFIHNGTDYRLYYDYDIGDPAASSTTVAGARFVLTFDNLWLPSASFKLACGITVVPTTGQVVVWAAGGDF